MPLEAPLEPLNLEHFTLPFIFLACGLGLSLIAFCWELRQKATSKDQEIVSDKPEDSNVVASNPDKILQGLDVIEYCKEESM